MAARLSVKDRAARRNQNQPVVFFKQAISEPNDYIRYGMCETDNFIWYILIENVDGPDGEFKGGQFLVRLEIDKKDPLGKPPVFYFLTPNGLYGVNAKVCVSIGEYHADQYRAVLGPAGFVMNLISGMIGYKDMGTGISILKTTREEKRKFAADSVSHNLANYAPFVNLVNTSYDAYSAMWPKKAADEIKSAADVFKVDASQLKMVDFGAQKADAPVDKPTAEEIAAADLAAAQEAERVAMQYDEDMAMERALAASIAEMYPMPQYRDDEPIAPKRAP